jgi:voltage-gated potassium channel
MMPLRGHKYLILLTVLVGGLIGQSLHHTAITAPAVLSVLQTITVVAVFLGVFEERRNRVVALWLGIVTAVVGWSKYVLPLPYHAAVDVAEHSLHMAFVGYAAIVILGDIFKRKLVRGDDVLGAACGYLLASAAWASLFRVCELLSPGSFHLSTPIAEQLATPQGVVGVFEYFSLATLTSVGYGDITPVRGPATAFAMLETVFGQFYIAVVVARLVGIRLTQGVQRSRE